MTVIRYLILALILSACADLQSSDQADAPPAVESDATIADADPFADAWTPDAALPPTEATIVQCQDMPRIDYYDGTGRVTLRLYSRSADIGSDYTGARLEKCGLSGRSLAGFAFCTPGVMVNCYAPTSQWPDLSCADTLAQRDEDGRYWVGCGTRYESDPDGDGVFEPSGSYDFDSYIRVWS